MQQWEIVLMIFDLAEGGKQADGCINFVMQPQVLAAFLAKCRNPVTSGSSFLRGGDHGSGGVHAQDIEAAEGEFEAVAAEPATNVEDPGSQLNRQDG